MPLKKNSILIGLFTGMLCVSGVFAEGTLFEAIRARDSETAIALIREEPLLYVEAWAGAGPRHCTGRRFTGLPTSASH